jgi:hypothetical protein
MMATSFEQTTLGAHIQRFFDASERSLEWAGTVREVIWLLNVEYR